MVRYEVAGYRPVGIPAPRPPQMGQVAPIRVAVGLSSLLVTALGAGTTWIGLRSGKRERGNMKIVSYGVAVFGALVAISGVTGVLGSILPPSLAGKQAQA